MLDDDKLKTTKKILHKYRIFDKLLDEQMEQIERANERMKLMDRLPKDKNRERLIDSTLVYKEAATLLYERVYRRKLAIEKCVMLDLNATEEEIFAEHYVKNIVWKGVLVGYDSRFKYSADKKLCEKMYNRIAEEEKEYKEREKEKEPT